jgi:hypothetical protein
MELIISILCDNNDDNISYENNTKLCVLIKIFLLCKRSKLTSCNIPYERVPLDALLEMITLDILLLDLAKYSSSQAVKLDDSPLSHRRAILKPLSSHLAIKLDGLLSLSSHYQAII